MKIYPLQAIYPNLSLVNSPEAFFGTVKEQYLDYEKSGFFKKSSQESLYIYQLTSPARKQTGIITCVDIQEFIKNKILKHENTLAAKEQQMMRLILQNRAVVKPVLVAYDRVAEVDDFLQDFMENNHHFFNIEFEDYQEKHTIWECSDGLKIDTLKELFKKKIKKAYIADGHHRVATSVQLFHSTKNHELDKPIFDRLLSVFFTFDDLKIWDYNRVIDILGTTNPLILMAKLSNVCKIKPLKKGRKPKKKHEFTLYVQKKWFRLRWKKKVLARHQNEVVLFDAFLLNEYILKDILHIKNIREDSRITYVNGKSGHKAISNTVNKDKNRIGICLFPIEGDNIKKVAEKGETLPPKSTWFEPRIKNGLIVQEF